MTTGKTIILTKWTYVGKVMSLLFNMLSRLVIGFLPRSKHLLISWLQSPSAVILEPKKIKEVLIKKNRMLCHILKLFLFPSLCWKHRKIFFSSIHCDDLMTSRTPGCQTFNNLGPPMTRCPWCFIFQACPPWAFSILSTIVQIFLLWCWLLQRILFQ